MQGQKLLYKRQHTEAAVRIQTARRGMLARRHYVRQKGAAVQIQSARRGFVARRRFKRQAGTHDELVRTRGRGGYGELEQQWLRHKHEQEATKTTGAWKRVRKSQVLWSLVASRQAANSRFCVFDAFDAQQRDLRAAFNATDVSGDGALDVDEIWRLVHSLGVSPEQLSRAELLDWIQRFDHDRSNTLNFREFADMMMEWKQQELRDMFELFDADASGSITTDELAEALPELGLYMSAANFEALLHNIDADGSGEISEAEFAQFLMPLMSFSRATGVYSVERVRDRAQLIMTIDGIGIRLENADGAVVEAAVYSYQEQQQPDGASPSSLAADELARMGVGQCGGSRSHPHGSRTPTLVFGAAENHGSGLVHARVIDSLLVVEIMKAGNFTEQMLRCESDRTAIKISRMLAENGNRQRLRWKVALRKQKNGLRAAFDAVDVDGNGTIGFSELRSMLSALGKSFTDAELRQVMRSLDVDASGHLEFHEFYDTMCSWQDQDLRDIFNYFDRDGDSLDVDEMAAVLKALGQELTIDDVIGLVKSLDYDCSGRVEVDEFALYMRPFLSIVHQVEYPARRLADDCDVIISINSMGLIVHSDDHGKVKSDNAHSDQSNDETVREALARHSEPSARDYSAALLVLGFPQIAAFDAVSGSMLLLHLCNQDEPEKFSSKHANAIAMEIQRQMTLRGLRDGIQREKKRQDLRAAFEGLDTSGDGLLDLSELKVLIRLLGEDMNDFQLQEKLAASCIAIPQELNSKAKYECTLHVRGCTGVTELELMRAFSQYGKCIGVTVRKRRQKGKDRSWALVTMADKSGFNQALQSQELVLENAHLTVRRFDWNRAAQSKGAMTSILHEHAASRWKEVKIDFNKFVDLTDRWLEQELEEVFHFFDDDGSGTMSLDEVVVAMLALVDMPADNASRLAQTVDSDRSGLVDIEEFSVLMRPLLSFASRAEYDVWDAEHQQKVCLIVSSIGVQIQVDGKKDSSVFFSLFDIVSCSTCREPAPGVVVTISENRNSGERTLRYETSAVHGDAIVASIAQQSRKLALRTDIDLFRQYRHLQSIFNSHIANAEGSVPARSVKHMMLILGYAFTEGEITSRFKTLANSSMILTFDDLIEWLTEIEQLTLKDTFDMLDQDGSGCIDLAELSRVCEILGQPMSPMELAQETNHPDGTGIIDFTEFVKLVEPLLALTHYAVFPLPEHEDLGGKLLVHGIGIQIGSTVYKYEQIVDVSGTDTGLVIVMKPSVESSISKLPPQRQMYGEADSNSDDDKNGIRKANVMTKVTLETNLADNIILAVKKQSGSIGLRVAIEQHKTPHDSSLSTALAVLRTDPELRTDPQLMMLRSVLGKQNLFQHMNLENERQQIQCCRYARARKYEPSDRIVEESSMSLNAYHVLAGTVSLRKQGTEVRQQWAGASFGALHVTGDTQFDNFGAVAVTECVLVWLKRVDYLRICSSLVPEVTQILKLAVEKRTEEQLDVISSFFHRTPLFNWLFYPDLQWECSKRLSYLGVQTGSIVVSQGERAKQVIMPLGSGELQAYTGVRESDDSDMRGNHIRELHAGDAIGLKCFQHDTATQGCGATVCAVVNSDCAVLRRTDWDAINKVKHKVYKALKKPFALRSRAEITRIWSMFKNAPLVRRLDSRLVQSHLCRLLAIETYEKDEFVYTQGDIGDHMYFVLDGALVVEKWRAKDQSRGMNAGRGEKTLGVGDEFGEAALMAKSEFDRRHKETVVATEKCRLAVLSRYHRTRLIESSDGIQDSIDMLWDLAMNTRYGADRLRGNEMLNQETYMKLYMNMVRLLHPEWTDEEAADLGRSDWLDDVRKSGTGRKELYHEHFSAVIYDLIDNWCDQIATSMYSAFIGAVYKNCRCFWRKVNAKDCRDLYVAPEAGQQVEQYVLAEPELTKSLTKQLQPVFADGREKYKRDIAADKQEIRRQHASRRHLKQKYKSMKRKESNLVQRSQRPKNGLAKRQGKSEVVADMHWNMLKTTYGAEFALQEEQSYFCQLLASRCEQPSWTTEQETQFRMLLVACVDVGNVRGGSQSGYDNLLDILQQAYFGDSLAAATARSNREVQRLEAKFGTVLEDSARALLVVRIMRKNEGSPYWLTSRTRAIDSATRSDDAQLKLLLKQHQLRAPTPDRDTSRLKSTRLTREQILAQEKLLEHQSRARVSAGVAHKLKRQRNSRLASQTLGTHRFAEPHYYASALANRRPKQRSQAAPAGTIVQTLDAAKQEVSLLGLAPPESATQPGRIAGYRLSPPDMDSSFISSVSPFWGPASPPPDAHAIVLTRPYSVHEAARSPPCPRRRHKTRGSKSPQLPLIDVKIRAE